MNPHLGPVRGAKSAFPDLRAGSEPLSPPRRRRDTRPDKLFLAIAVLAVLGTVGYEYFGGDTTPPVVAVSMATASQAPLNPDPIAGTVGADAMSELDTAFASPDAGAVLRLAGDVEAGAGAVVGAGDGTEVEQPARLALHPTAPTSTAPVFEEPSDGSPLEVDLAVLVAEVAPVSAPDVASPASPVLISDVAPDVQDQALAPEFMVASIEDITAVTFTALGLADLPNAEPAIADDAPDIALPSEPVILQVADYGSAVGDLPAPLVDGPNLNGKTAFMVRHLVGAPATRFPQSLPHWSGNSSPFLVASTTHVPDLEGVRRAAILPKEPARVSVDLTGITVRVHAPNGFGAEDMALLTLDLAGTGAELTEPVPSFHSISDLHVRYYHREFEEQAQGLADLLGISVRSFTKLKAKPRRGIIELWIDGVAPAAIARRSKATPRLPVQPSTTSARTSARSSQDRIILDPNIDSDGDKIPWWRRLGLSRPPRQDGAAAAQSGNTTSTGPSNGNGNGNGNGNSGGSGNSNGNSGNNGNGNGKNG